MCDLFTTAEITNVLGVEVARVTPKKQGRYMVCTWRATTAPRVPEWRKGDPVLAIDDGIVTITRGRAKDYPDLERKVMTAAKRKKAAGRQEINGVGLQAFAVGASVSGVPIWYAVALHDDVVTAVEVSGADTNSSVATVSNFLAQTVGRG